MLNLKKGLALVLAAATAFTFAPVANLGQAVSVRAASVQDQNYNLDSDDIVAASIKVAQALSTQVDGAIAEGYGRLTIMKLVDVNPNTQYTISNLTNVENVYYATSEPGDLNQSTADEKKLDPTKVKAKLTPIKNQQTTTKTAAAAGGASTTTLWMVFDITSQNGGSFQLADKNTASENSYAHINVNITNTKGVGDPSEDEELKILQHGATQLEVAPRENGSSDSRAYNLQINKSSTPYYVSYKNGDVTSWTGVAATITSATAESYSGSLSWDVPNSETGNYITTLVDNASNETTSNVINSGKIKAGETNPAVRGNLTHWSKNAFFVTTATPSTQTITVKFYDADNKVIDTKTLNYTVERSEHAISWIRWQDSEMATADQYDADASAIANKYSWKKNGDDAYTLAFGATPDDAYKELDPYKNTSATITVKSESQTIHFLSSDDSIVSVKQNSSEPYIATVKANASGSATISVFVGSTNNNKGKIYNIPVKVKVNGDDTISVSDSQGFYGLEQNDTINLDATDQTASNAKTEDVLTFTSAGGLQFADVVKGGDAVTVSQNGGVIAVKANKKIADVKNGPAMATISMTSKTAKNGNIQGQTKTVTVLVWAKPAAEFTVDPVYLSLNDPSQSTKLLKTNPDTFKSVSWTITKNQATSTQLTDDGSNTAFTLSNDSVGGNTQTTSKAIAQRFGSGEVKALVAETDTTRPTAKKAAVTVGAGTSADADKADSSFKVTSDSIVNLEAGKTATVSSSGAIGAVTESSSDEKVATIKDGVITAVAPGSAIITLKDTGDAKVKAGTVQIFVTVTAAPEEYENPAQITGVKLGNKKGAKVVVKFNKDNTSKNIKYYVQKKVGKKTSGKSVGSNRTVLSVKKGATVKVRVKAYYYDANGDKHVGAWSKWVTKKTDKK